MAVLTVTSAQLDRIGFYKVMRNFIMFPRKGWHIRLDQKPHGRNGPLSLAILDGKNAPTGDYSYLISSFHVKRDENHSFNSTTEGPLLGAKIVQEESDYVYFKYVDGGVWQPIWGYNKLEQKHKGQSIWKRDSADVDRDDWGFACENARWFLKQLSKAVGSDQGLAMGPIQGAEAHLFGQL
ncbi:hypothetical protein [Falsiroseomonas sp.]|uniref:hypothetical protein n=1 Tax=Falsiroseomonas sp. TaxID=2870721 RepID=UPI003565397B